MHTLNATLYIYTLNLLTKRLHILLFLPTTTTSLIKFKKKYMTSGGNKTLGNTLIMREGEEVS